MSNFAKRLQSGTCAAAILICAANGGSAAAQTASSSATNGSERQIEDIVVVARKVAEDLQDVPISITALSGDTLKQQVVRDVYDLQAQVPNLVIQQGNIDPQALFVSIRGQVQNDITANLDPAVGIYFDGIYYPRTIGLSGQMLDIERIEVLRGPQGTLYGRNTTGGALSIFTKNPTGDLGASVELTGGSRDLVNGVAIVNVPLGEGVAARFVAQRGKDDGYGRDAAGNKRGNDDSVTFRGKLRSEFGNGGEAILTGVYFKNETGGGVYHISAIRPTANSTTIQVARQTGLGTTPAGLAATIALIQSFIDGNRYNSADTVPQFSDFIGKTVSLDVKIPFSDAVDFRSLTGYEALRRKTSINIAQIPFAIVGGRQDNDSYYVSQEFQLLGDSGNFNWVVGAYGGYEHARESSNTTLIPLVTAVNPRTISALLKNTNLSAFAQATWQFSKGWNLTAGARYSHDKRQAFINNVQGTVCTVPAAGVAVTPPGASDCGREFAVSYSKPSWLVSLDHDLTDDVLVYAKVSRGYRSGGINYRGANSVDTFADFAPEIVTEYEAGIKASFWDRRGTLNLAAFHEDYKNIQRTATIIGPVSGLSTSIITNAAKGEIKGFEAELRLRPAQGLTLGASAGLTGAKYKLFIDITGNRTAEPFPIPKWKGGFNASYVQPLDFGELSISASYQWQSFVDLQPAALLASAVSQPRYGLLDGRIALTIESLDMDIAVFGKNLADKKYRAAAVGNDSSLGFDTESLGQPRTIGVTLTKRFGAIR